MPPRRSFTGKAAGTEPVTEPVSEPAAEPSPPPVEAAPPPPPPPMAPASRAPRRRGRGPLWTGGLLIVIGVFFLLGNLGLLWWWRWDVFWPLVLISFGIYLIVRRFR